MLRMLISIIFLGLILIPVFVLFVALYQNLQEVPKPKHNMLRRRTEVGHYNVDPEELLPARLRIVK